MIRTTTSVFVLSQFAFLHSLSVLAKTNSNVGSAQGSDYLLCQLSADKKLSTIESLPAEILGPILEEVSLVV